MTCADRGTVRDKPYCKRQGGFCTSWRFVRCKRDIFFGLFMALSIAYFAYGIIYAWQNAEDRVERLKKIEHNKVADMQRLDVLEQMILDEKKKGEARDQTVANHWKDLDKKLKELRIKEGVE